VRWGRRLGRRSRREDVCGELDEWGGGGMHEGIDR